MITLVSGNICLSRAEALVNTVNCQGICGAGVAKDMKLMFPDNFEKYHNFCMKRHFKPGALYAAHTKRDRPPFYIFNVATKNKWQAPSRLEWIKEGLNQIDIYCKVLQIKSIAIPPLGCGNGGLNWSIVKPLIIETFEQLPKVEVYLFEPQKR